MFWGLELSSCKVVSFTPEYPLHVTKCTLADAGSSGAEQQQQKNVVQCQVGSSSNSKNQTFIITSLVADTKEQASLDLVFEPGKRVAFFNSGPGTVHLTGFYVTLVGEDDYEDDDEAENSEEEAREEAELIELLFNDEPRRRRGNLERFNNENEREKKVKTSAAASATTQKAQKRRVSFVDESQQQQEEQPQPPPKVLKVSKEAVKASKEPTKEIKKANDKKKEVTQKSPATRRVGNSGLLVQDIVVGTGPSPVRGRKIVVGYVGKLTNGKVFDKSDKRYPFTFKFGAGEVIKGWDLGIAGMKVGGKRKLTIPPELGYGREGSWPIPPNATLVFDVELIAVK